MTGKRAKSAERTSFGTPGTTETLGALHSPPVASGELCRLLPSTPFQSSSGECRLKAYKAGDYATALKIWTPLADQGFVLAQVHLGLLYGKGEGVIQDTMAAHMCFNIAVANGDEGAV